MDQWINVELGECAKFLSGGTPPPDEIYWNGDIPWISAKSLHESRISTSEDKVTEIGAQTGTRLVPPGTILILVRGMMLRKRIPLGIAITPVTFNQDVKALIAKPEIEPEYLLYALMQREEYLLQLVETASHGTGKLSTDVLESTVVPLPPLPEQRAIAVILSTWDEAITLTRRLIEALQQRKRALMEVLLTGQVRFPGFDGEWETKRLGDFLTLTLRKVEKPDEPYYALSLRNYGQGTLVRFVEDPSGVAMEHLYEVREGDLVVSITFAWEGSIAMVGADGDGKLVSHRFPTYVFDHNKMRPEFFKYLMITDDFFFKLGLISPGGAGRNRVLNKKDFLNLVVTSPELNEQDMIGGILSANDQYIQGIEAYLDRLQAQKRGLMQQLLTGAVRVQVDD